jgi:hypothetical protein
MGRLITFHLNEYLVGAFLDNGVDFLIVGGLAVAFYGCRDNNDVGDLDLLLKPSEENARRSIDVLKKPLLGLAVDFIDIRISNAI